MSSKNTKKKLKKKTVEEIRDIRTGGQIALSGFSYQMLYSCYLILNEIDALTQFHLEGIEDIDSICLENGTQTVEHIQIKYSSKSQDASFLKPVLKNMLEVYLANKNRKFKLVYDFKLAKGNMSKLFSGALDISSQSYWERIVGEIQNENSDWDWENFEFIVFINNISFENIKRDTLQFSIEKILIDKYDIITDNVVLFVNGIKVCCWDNMSNRELVYNWQIDTIIQNIKDDIAKGIQNPAHHWIKRIRFDCEPIEDTGYFEGKKATPQDIVNCLPASRNMLEQEIKSSIFDNKVTVIKASSGQGKTTLAFQTAFSLINEYSIYLLLWCDDARELNNIVMYFESRIKLGEKLLILIDNLDYQFSVWNRLAQIMQEQVGCNYKILITTREDDWYNYAGDISNVKSINIIKILLEEQDAREIYLNLQKNDKLHSSISDWHKAWSDVEDRQLLIEYVYLLTHGKMLSDRIAEQIIQINKTETGGLKCELLRLISFADICGVRLSIKKLISQFPKDIGYDFGEVLKSMESEFMIRIDDFEKYIEGLHPVRSQHIVDRLHEFIDISETAISVVKISDKEYLAKLFSNFPNLINNKELFYTEVVESLWGIGLDLFIEILQGTFSGSIMRYYKQNKSYFDDANDCGGLLFIATESSPFVSFKEFDYKLEILSSLKETIPNSNIDYLNNIKDKIPKIILSETDSYILSKAIFEKTVKYNMDEFGCELESFVILAYWLLNIDGKFNLSKIISLDNLWQDIEKYNLETISKIMYLCFCGDRDVFLSFSHNNLQIILTYLKEWTNSLELYVSGDYKTIHVKYILSLSEIENGNEESVNRIKSICRTLPIFDTYCADGIKPNIEMIGNYKIPNDDHKTMPISNIFIMFHQEFTVLWNNTIMSNYEFDSVSEWLDFWFTVRKDIIHLLDKCDDFMVKLLAKKTVKDIGSEIDNLRMVLNKKMIRNNGYPRENRPFENERVSPPACFSNARKYFDVILNFFNQFSAIIIRDEERLHLPIINLRNAVSEFVKMQICFSDITKEHDILRNVHDKLCVKEDIVLIKTQMICMYYLKHSVPQYCNILAIKKWYDENYLDNINKAKESLVELEYEYNVIYPETFIDKGTLSYYPIIINNIDLTDGKNIITFMYKCTPFIEIDLDYLIVAFKDKNEKISENGLKITKKCLLDIKYAFDHNDLKKLEELSPLYPEKITDRILDCFNTKFYLINSKITGYERLDIIAELLWIYSKIRVILIDKRDFNYRDKLLNNYENKIFAKLNTYESSISDQLYGEINDLCYDVIQGVNFSDYEYNNFIFRIVEIINCRLNIED